MNLEQYRTRPPWATYEAQLLARDWAPYWDDADRARLEASGALTCGKCEGSATYVGMSSARTRLGFVVCLGLGDALCEDWMWFLAPLSDHPQAEDEDE